MGPSQATRGVASLCIELRRVGDRSLRKGLHVATGSRLLQREVGRLSGAEKLGLAAQKDTGGPRSGGFGPRTFSL